MVYNHQLKRTILRGWVKFPTGGKARERFRMIRCDSGADSIVWMREESRKNRCCGLTFMCILADYDIPDVMHRGFFCDKYTKQKKCP